MYSETLSCWLKMLGQQNDALVVQCDKTNLYIAYLWRKKEFDKVEVRAGDLLLQVDGGTPVTFSASTTNWNDNYGGIIASGRTPELVAVLHAIMNANHGINIGTIIGGNRYSASFDVAASTNAVGKAIKECGLDNKAGQ